jgi:formylglycine-generating enzyme required for sulfatase activity
MTTTSPNPDRRRRCALVGLLLGVGPLFWGCQGTAEGRAEEDPPETGPQPSQEVAPGPSGSTAPAPPPKEYEREELPEPDLATPTLAEQRQAMLRRMLALGVIQTREQVSALEAIMAPSKIIGQGNPDIVEHPITQKECMLRRKRAGVLEEKKPLCGAPYMTPVYDPAKEQEKDAKVCIDRYEFPGIPCEYPMTWVTTKQAQEMCKVLGKRLCDAHEWEGACAGALLPPEKDYNWGPPRDTQSGMHNLKREILWAYGPKVDHSKCATSSRKSKSCTSSGWKKCGSNSFPAGSFPECRSPFGVYDQHGNVAEHMALPLKKEELGKDGGFGIPEMKGSWFIFQTIEAHKDDCRWRSPSWHDNEGHNHSNYHLGFRCCKDVRP